MRKTQILMNLKETNAAKLSLLKVDIFSYRPMQIAKNLDPFESSVLVIMGN